LVLMPSMDLKCFSMIMRSLGLRTLFVTMNILLEHGQINSTCNIDLIFFRRVLI